MKINTVLPGLVVSLAATIMGGCASQPQLTQEQIMAQHRQVASLDTALQLAKSKDAELLAPEGYDSASRALENAMTAVQGNDSEAAAAAANKGLQTINKLNQDIQSNHEILAEVLQARARAHAAGVRTLLADKVADLDEDLKSTAALVENGKIEKAKQRRPKLLAGYAELELVALKQSNAELARSSIANAKQQGAEKLAPKTLAQAEEKLALAVTILDADRTQTDKADAQAKRAKWLADKSAAIAETVKDFDRRDYSMEDVVLWHQQQLSLVNEPLGGELPFNQPADKVTLSLKDAVSSLIRERDMERDNNKAARERYGKQLAMTEKERLTLQQKDQAEKQKFDRVQAMFTGKEANVYRQKQNVLISAHGFQFPSGQSEIQTANFPLMSKIIQAIKIFPNARIEVDGHTDSTGDPSINQKLSEARALKVSKFLTEVGGIGSKYIRSRGYGESRPVATNETAQGRAENRRVEIRIVNE